MNKTDLRKLALMGLAGGIVLANGSSAEATNMPTTPTVYLAAGSTTTKATTTSPANDPNAGNMNWHLMTEKELLLELNNDGVTLYKSLTPAGKQLALKVASAMCNGTNECSGLNGCKTDHNECAGKGACKGKGKCAIADKNLAVQLVAKKMAEKRANAY